MIVGLMADIHANLPALEAVLKHAPAVDQWVCAGDIVAYYADCNEVCDRLREIGAWVIRGNHDAYVTGQLVPNSQRREAYRTDWTRQTLQKQHLVWLESLPVEMDFAWGKKRLRVRHACPWDEETYLYPNSPRLEEIHLPDDELLVVGHTHYPLQRLCGHGLLINPGSVGQPRDRIPLASYAILDVASSDLNFCRRAPYDTISLQRRLTEQGWSDDMVRILNRTQ